MEGLASQSPHMSGDNSVGELCKFLGIILIMFLMVLITLKVVLASTFDSVLDSSCFNLICFPTFNLREIFLQEVAVKLLNKQGLQGSREFKSEIEMLSPLKHPNIVNFIGCCYKDDRRIIVYEFLSLGSLENHLHG
ncbi:hypothetical protein HHK36_012473 [Tetracentron sinense]|uniref:Protein kinase domain-containing protein n=1 Tax=Tetracentron sinense TaxID=13715 RepID=A0A835DFI8_TETSI|nr:hypothetical protein HHK36_012473 [Tetracentron sinense]